MARLVLCALALLVAGGLADPVRNNVPQKPADPVFAKRQMDLMTLFFHVLEPNYIEANKVIVNTWSLEKNIEHFSNVTAVTTYIKMLENQCCVPRAVPFSILEDEHKFEVVTLFNVLHSAKDYDTFYKTAVYVRDRVNPDLFSYVLSAVIVNRPDTKGIYIPRVFEIFPSYFNNGEIMTTAARINTHGDRLVDFYPSTYKWDKNVVIRWNPHLALLQQPEHTYSLLHSRLQPQLILLQRSLSLPGWLQTEALPVNQHRRGEWFWFLHKQLIARYYMERLSNGLGEIPELGHETVKDGTTRSFGTTMEFSSPVRPNNFNLDQPEFVNEVEQIYDYERRVRDAIDQGYVLNHLGERIDISAPEAIEILGRVIEANVDSPNVQYYKDFISVWKKVLGNSLVHEHQYFHHYIPLVVPSVLEHYQTALRDPAFYMIWKRVLGLFQQWQEKLPHYKPEELAMPQVAIEKVDVDKLVTYFEYSYMNVTSGLPMNVEEAKELYDQVSVLVQHPRLNHKKFQVRVNVKTEVAKTVLVKFFLAPKYDSHGHEIPLHVNSYNFMQLDEFVYDLPQGESVITRDSVETTGNEWTTSYQVWDQAEKASREKHLSAKNMYFQDVLIYHKHTLNPCSHVE
uniref:Acidic juvenile hormone-suppressible protein 1 n=1 Tax=Trichoplusia ni TaxID=7111 RepID=AJSP1_TRINI|nr:RecName: Full=Acidic juvenile hormone-suppressible protein 1; Short=AJHSP1; Flags: Precursor [Trichoplusia ni]